MKSGIFWKCNLGVSLILLPLTGFCTAENPSATNTEPAKVLTQPETNQAVIAESSVEKPAATNDITTAPVQLVSEEKPLPPSIRPSRPAAEVIKLANSGVGEGVLMAFVTNSTSTFNLSAEEIIYFKDIGVPDAVVTAMIKHDQELITKAPETSLAAATPWIASPGPNLAPPPPEEVAPQPNPATEPYPTEPAPPVTEVADDSAFYSGLSPYGNWVNVSGYGTCWQPTVAVSSPGWQPYYSCGRWVWTDCGWYWLSDYSWGWAPFHYGRWFHHHTVGWCWAPDHVWGPSWVCWRYTDNYCGWAPLPPGSVYVAGVGITYHGHAVNHSEDFGLRPDHYQFVAWQHFSDRDLHNKRLSPAQNNRLFRDSVVATRIRGDGQKVVNDGLSPERVTAATHVAVRTTELRDNGGIARPSGRAERFDPTGRTLAIYRPKSIHPPVSPGQAPGAESAASALRSPSAPSTASAASSPSSPPAQSSRSAPSAPSSTLATTFPPGSHDRNSSTYNRTQPDESKLANPSSRSSQNLILRGAQPSASHESVPPSSLVIIGRKNNGQTAAGRPDQQTDTTWVPNEGRDPVAWNNSPTPWAQSRSPATVPSQQNFDSTANSSAPAYVPRNNSTWNGYQRPSAYQPAQNYQQPARTAPPQVPRYAPAPVNSAPQAAAPPPAAAAPARSAPSAPAQPARNR